MPPPNSRAVATIPPEKRLELITTEYDRNADSLARLLPDTIDAGRYRELFLQEVTRDPKLLQCAPASLIRATFDMAKLGLEPVLGEAYLVPFWSTKLSVYQATLIIGYHGLSTLAFNSGFVTLIEGEVVNERDDWTYVRGYPESVLRHVPAKGDRGPVIGAWAMVWLRDVERPLTGYLELDRIEQRRLVSRSGTDRETKAPIGIWREWQREMFLKTALRFTLNLAPKAVRARVAQALDLEDAVDSLLRLESNPGRQLAAGKGTARRRRMLARLTGAPTVGDEVEGESKDLPEGNEPAGSPETGANPEPAPSGADADTAAAQPDAGAGAAESAAPETAGLCGAVHPEKPDVTCGLAAGHLGLERAPQMHRKLDAAGKALESWPAPAPA